MPMVPDSIDPGARTAETEIAPPKPDPTWGELFTSSFHQENEMVSLARSIRPDKEVDPNFHVGDWLTKFDATHGTTFMQDNRDAFLDASNEKDALYRVSRLAEEAKDKDTIERSGWWGTLASMTAGAVSPTMMIPFIGEGSRGVQLAKAAGYAALGAGIQETALYKSQLSRTKEEGVFSVAASAVLGGILGGAHVMLHGGERAHLLNELNSTAADVKGLPNGPRATIKDILDAAKTVREEGRPPEDVETVLRERGLRAPDRPPNPAEAVMRYRDENFGPELRGAEDVRTSPRWMTPEIENGIRDMFHQLVGDHARVKFDDVINIIGRAEGWGETTPTAKGKINLAEMLVTFSRSEATPDTIYHEAFHVIQSLLLNNEEKAVLAQNKENLKAIVRQAHPQERVDGMAQHELEAEAFAIWNVKRDVAPPKGLEALWNKLAEVYDKIRGVVASKGTTVDDIFNKARSGELARRDPEAVKRENIEAVRTKDPQLAEELMQSAWHGSPHWFDKFMTKFMGSGEGAQVYGWGLYFAQRKGIAEHYRDTLTHSEPVRHVKFMQVDSPVNDEFAGNFASDEVESNIVGIADSAVSHVNGVFKPWEKFDSALEDDLVSMFSAFGIVPEGSNYAHIQEFNKKLHDVFMHYSESKEPYKDRMAGFQAEMKAFVPEWADKNSWGGYLEKPHVKDYMDAIFYEMAYRLPTITEGESVTLGGTATLNDARVHLGDFTQRLVENSNHEFPFNYKQVQSAAQRYLKNVMRNDSYTAHTRLRSKADFIYGMIDAIQPFAQDGITFSDVEHLVGPMWDRIQELEYKDIKGRLYKVELPDDEDLLHYNKTFEEQSPKVQRALETLGYSGKLDIKDFNGRVFMDDHGEEFRAHWVGGKNEWYMVPQSDMGSFAYYATSDELKSAFFFSPSDNQHAGRYVEDVLRDGTDSKTGEDIIYDLEQLHGSPKNASLALRDAGIPGHRFYDAESRGDMAEEDRTHNFVIYKDEAIEIKEYFQQNFRATETPEFKKWFRNGVVHEEGFAKAMYHATKDDIEKFDHAKVGAGQLGFHIGTLNQADHFAWGEDANIMPVYTNIQNPIRLEDRGGWRAKDIIPQLFDKGLITEKRYNELLEATKGQSYTNDFMIDVLRNLGYDGVVYLNRFEGHTDGSSGSERSMFTDVSDSAFKAQYGTGQDSYIVFKPSNIKSVYNKGAWSPTDPRISYQISDEQVPKLARGAARVARANDAVGVIANPVTKLINESEFITAKQAALKMSDSGLAMEGNDKGFASTTGGTIENRIIPYWGKFDAGASAVNEAFVNYMFGREKPKIAAGVRATIKGMRDPTRLSRDQFNTAVALTLFNGMDTAPNEFVRAAAEAARKEVYDPIMKEAVKVGLLKENQAVIGDNFYGNRIYNDTAINADPIRFINILAKNGATQMRENFLEQLAKFRKKQKANEQFVVDASTSPEEYERLVQELQGEEKKLGEEAPTDHFETEMTLDGLKFLRDEAKRAGDYETAAHYDAERKQYEKDNYHKIKPTRDAQAAIRRRLDNLSRGTVALERDREKKINQLGKLYSANMDGLSRVARSAQSVLRKLDRVSDKELNAEVVKLKNNFARVAGEYDRLVERVHEEEYSMDNLLSLDKKLTSKADRLTVLAANLGDAEKLDRTTLRDLINQALEETKRKVNEINGVRSARAAKIAGDLDKMDPMTKLLEIEQRRQALTVDERAFVDRYEKPVNEGGLGGKVDMEKGDADFTEQATKWATKLKDKITGSLLHVPIVEVMKMERGPELARFLNIKSELIQDFLETDVNKMMRAYVRTFAPDIEIARTFGSIDFNDVIQPVLDEFNDLSKKIDQGTEPADRKSNSQLALRRSYEADKLRLSAMFERLRFTRGLPKDPHDYAYRAGRVVQNLNVLRQMGMVTTASLPDLARPVMRYGLSRTFRDGVIPLITNFKNFKLSALEGRYSGAATDGSAHMRAMGLFDALDDLQRGTKLERGIQYATNHMGVIALFDVWTDGMKLISSAIANGKFMEAIATMNGQKGLMTEAEAMNFLAQNSIDGAGAKMIWKEMVENGGAERINGVWYPNTQSWKNDEAVQLYRQALAREVNTTIVTPGIEKPLYADVNQLGRMLYQFKSFGLSSTSKIVLSGLQQQDAAVLNGTLFALAMGAVSYGSWAMLSGGNAYDDMKNAGLDRWADEMIQRSGIMGSLGEVQRVGQNIPLIAPAMSFSGKKSTRRPGDNLVEALLGPSFDLGQTAAGIITSLPHPTQGTAHQLRKSIPFNNTMIIRELFDAVESSLKGILPERKAQ